jgi:hypothetical protein
LSSGIHLIVVENRSSILAFMAVLASVTQSSSPVNIWPSKEWQPMKEGRMERRTAMGFVAQIEKMSDPSVTETVWIDNLTNQGARVLARRSTPTDDLLVLSSPKPGFHSVVAKVVYCQRLPNGAVAMGLEFDGSRRVSVSETSQKAEQV